jgi:mRNA interferase RelE/StbE
MRRLPRELLERIRRSIAQLAVNPRPPGCKRLTGREDLYRIRVGDWRIIYAIVTEESTVLVTDIAPRGRVYRDL